MSNFNTYSRSYENMIEYLKGDRSNEELVRLIREGDEDARNELFANNYYWLKKMAKSMDGYAGSALDAEDLCIIGAEELLYGAVDNYDEAQNTSYWTYASTCVRYRMHEEINKKKYASKLPAKVVQKMLKVEKENDQLSPTLSRKERIRVIAENCRMSYEDAEKYLDLNEKYSHRVSLDEMIETGRAEDSRLCDNSAETFDNTVYQSELFTAMDHALRKLDEKEEKIIRFKYGFEDNKQKSGAATAREFNYSQAYICQVERKALQKLGNMPELKDYSDYCA